MSYETLVALETCVIFCILLRFLLCWTDSISRFASGDKRDAMWIDTERQAQGLGADISPVVYDVLQRWKNDEKKQNTKYKLNCWKKTVEELKKLNRFLN